MRLTVLTSLCLVLACTKQEASPEPAADPAPTEADGPSAAASPSGGDTANADQPAPETSVVPRPTLELTSPGTAPRRVLQWSFTEGMRATVSISMDMQIKVTTDDLQQPTTPTPAIVSTLELVVQEVDEAGTAIVGFTVTKIGTAENDAVPAQVASQIESDLQTIVGFRGSYRCEASGFVPHVSARLPPQASAAVRQAIENIRQSLRQMTVLLPDEPVGRGAQWTLEADYTYSGMKVNERATFTLKKLRFPNVVAAVSIEQTAPPQTLTGSDGRTGDLESLRSQATGINRWNMKLLGPVSVARDTSMEMVMKGPDDDGRVHQVTLAIDFTLQVDGQ